MDETRTDGNTRAGVVLQQMHLPHCYPAITLYVLAVITLISSDGSVANSSNGITTRHEIEISTVAEHLEEILCELARDYESLQSGSFRFVLKLPSQVVLIF